MLLKILLDPDFDEKSYETFKVESQTIYAEVSSVNQFPDYVIFHLKETPVWTINFGGMPIFSSVSIRANFAQLHCKWASPDADGRSFIHIKVEVEECDRFPAIKAVEND